MGGGEEEEALPGQREERGRTRKIKRGLSILKHGEEGEEISSGRGGMPDRAAETAVTQLALNRGQKCGTIPDCRMAVSCEKEIKPGGRSRESGRSVDQRRVQYFKRRKRKVSAIKTPGMKVV